MNEKGEFCYLDKILRNNRRNILFYQTYLKHCLLFMTPSITNHSTSNEWFLANRVQKFLFGYNMDPQIQLDVILI